MVPDFTADCKGLERIGHLVLALLSQVLDEGLVEQALEWSHSQEEHVLAFRREAGTEDSVATSIKREEGWNGKITVGKWTKIQCKIGLSYGWKLANTTVERWPKLQLEIGQNSRVNRHYSRRTKSPTVWLEYFQNYHLEIDQIYRYKFADPSLGNFSKTTV